MTPDKWRRTDIERACQRMSDEYDRKEAERAEWVRKTRNLFSVLLWSSLFMCAAAGAYCLWTLIARLVAP